MSDMQQWVEVKNEKTGGVYYFNKIVREMITKHQLIDRDHIARQTRDKTADWTANSKEFASCTFN